MLHSCIDVRWQGKSNAGLMLSRVSDVTRPTMLQACEANAQLDVRQQVDKPLE